MLVNCLYLYIVQCD